MATNTVRLQNIFDGIQDAAVAVVDIDARTDDCIYIAKELEIVEFFAPTVVTKATLTSNQKKAWFLHKFGHIVDGIRKQAKRERREAARAAQDAADQ